ncbi:hypothetical protein DV736_g3907, partial [Chaetothyriales sp. CBS 134916]
MQDRTVTSDELSESRRMADFCPVFKVDETTVVKSGDSVRFAEAAALRLVREQTSIPVPEVHNVYRDEASGHVRIVMEFIEGDVLDEVWEQFGRNQKDEVIQQLRGFFAQLRGIQGTFIGSVDGTACEDPLFTDQLGAYGPYEDEPAFNKGIVKALESSSQGAWAVTISDVVLDTLKDHNIVMSHGDISPRNILVRGTKVVAILDWEMSGFYPEYWDYVKSLYKPAWESGWIKDKVAERILRPYYAELAVMLHVHNMTW